MAPAPSTTVPAATPPPTSPPIQYMEAVDFAAPNSPAIAVPVDAVPKVPTAPTIADENADPAKVDVAAPKATDAFSSETCKIRPAIAVRYDLTCASCRKEASSVGAVFSASCGLDARSCFFPQSSIKLAFHLSKI